MSNEPLHDHGLPPAVVDPSPVAVSSRLLFVVLLVQHEDLAARAVVAVPPQTPVADPQPVGAVLDLRVVPRAATIGGSLCRKVTVVSLVPRAATIGGSLCRKVTVDVSLVPRTATIGGSLCRKVR